MTIVAPDIRSHTIPAELTGGEDFSVDLVTDPAGSYVALNGHLLSLNAVLVLQGILYELYESVGWSAVIRYTEEEMFAEMRREMEAHWKLKLRGDLTTLELASLFHAYAEETSGAEEAGQ
ncbi:MULTISPECIES: hypothetical protein [Mycolicibacterium]|uniref:hypothetical protein n=1 Tax=Mycolicibacterium TaxID=1866885 RepID=UPI00148F667D|nr:hypothetical protein [Mycolicibacterium fortuitum]